MRNDKKIESLARNIAKDPQDDARIATIKAAMIRLTANAGKYLDDAVELSDRVMTAADACTNTKAAVVLKNVATAILKLPCVAKHKMVREMRDAEAMARAGGKTLTNKSTVDKDTTDEKTTTKKASSSVVTTQKRTRLGA